MNTVNLYFSLFNRLFFILTLFSIRNLACNYWRAFPLCLFFKCVLHWKAKSSSQNGDDNIYGRSQTMKSTVKSLIIKCGCLTRETSMIFFLTSYRFWLSFFLSPHRFFPYSVAHRTQPSVFFAIDSIRVVRRLNA